MAKKGTIARDNNAAARELMADDRKKQHIWEQSHVNKWERAITAIHWLDPIGVEDTNALCNEQMMMDLLKNNKPCLTAFAFFKSIGDAVVRNGIDKYSTKIDAAKNIIGTHGLIPIDFAEWRMEERIISPRSGKPVNVVLNHFSGWRAEFVMDYQENVYTLDQILNFINMAGFGLGIGSGRKSGYGRYHVVSIK